MGKVGCFRGFVFKKSIAARIRVRDIPVVASIPVATRVMQCFAFDAVEDEIDLWRFPVISIQKSVLPCLNFSVWGRTLCGIMIVSGCLTSSLAWGQAKREIPENHPYVPVLKLAYAAQAAIGEVKDYQGVLTKRELIGKKLQTHQMEIKVRHEPFSVYLKFREPFAGREVLYVAGKNNNQMLGARGVGSIVADWYHFPPVGFPGSDEGQQVSDQHDRHEKHDRQDDRNLGVRDAIRGMRREVLPQCTTGNVPCRVVETSHPTPRRQFRFSLVRLYIDRETNLPIRCECFGFPMTADESAPLVEEYTYTSLRINIGLRDFDFDRTNPSYQF